MSGLSYFWRTNCCRDHLGLVDSSKQVHQCKPYPENLEHSSQVVKEIKERDSHVKHQVRVVTKRSLESRQVDDVIVVENFGKRTCLSMDGPFKIVRTREEMDM